eukprot:1554716-Prymnesium_polylepis.1
MGSITVQHLALTLEITLKRYSRVTHDGSGRLVRLELYCKEDLAPLYSVHHPGHASLAKRRKELRTFS